jgi:hypothetical protein
MEVYGLESVTHDKDQWWALVNTVISLFYRMFRISCLPNQLPFSKSLCSMQLQQKL